MNFTDIVNSVLDDCKRPDKLNAIRIAVNSAVLYYSTEMDYEQDLIELTLPIVAPTDSVALALSDLQRFRKIDYIRRAGTRQYYCKLESRVLTSSCDVRNKWYIGGSTLYINATDQVNALDISYYAYPPRLTDDAPDFWMLHGNWPAITYRAAAEIFKAIGDADSSARAAADALTAYTAFRGDYVRSNQHT